MKKNETKRKKKPWPTKDAMTQVYKKKLWGDNATEFYSGTGSHDPKIIQPYLAAVISFLTSFKTPMVVCDLGCGDFNIGSELVQYTGHYIAIDVVADLIKHNKETFNEENLEFRCLDISRDALPSGDCALIRQVLQHLSNTEIQRIVSKLAAFKYVLLTEHVPAGTFEPNKEIISGQGTRLKIQSGVDIEASPFHFKGQEKKELVSVVPEGTKGVIVTTLYKNF